MTQARGREPDLGSGRDAPARGAARAPGAAARARRCGARRAVPFYREALARGRRRRRRDPHGSTTSGACPSRRRTTSAGNYPLGLLAVPRAEIARIHGSSGTTGQAHLRRLHAAGPRDLVRPRAPASSSRAGSAPSTSSTSPSATASSPAASASTTASRRSAPAIVPAAGGNTPRQMHAHPRPRRRGARLHALLRAPHRRGRAARRGSARARCRSASATSAASPGPRRCASRSSATSASSPSTTTASPR